MKELHVHMSSNTLPSDYCVTLYDTKKELYGGKDVVHTVQTNVISTEWLVRGYRLFVHMIDSEVAEIKLGKNENTDKDIRVAHKIEVLVLSGTFGYADIGTLE